MIRHHAARALALGLALAAGSAVWAAGPSSAGFAIPLSVFNSGVRDVDSASFNLSSSLGDALFTAPLASTSFRLAPGLWPAGEGTGPGSQNFQGIWWAAPAGSEDGWGINFNHQGDTIFATWFTFGLDGKPLWLVVAATKTEPNVYSGSLVTGTGPPFSAVPFPPIGTPGGAMGTSVGTATFTFTDGNHAEFKYEVQLAGMASPAMQTKQITREQFGPWMPGCIWGAQPDLTVATNYQDVWWAAPAASEDGWGINFAHQGDTIFATWFTYGPDGKATWFVVAVSKTAASPPTFTGTLFQVVGPPFNATPFPPVGSPGGATGTPVGTVTLTFTDGNNATFAYTVNGISQSKAITREILAPPGTVCQ